LAATPVARHIRKNVAEHIGGHKHVEALGPLHQLQRGRIDQLLIGHDIGVLLGHLQRRRAKQPTRLAHHIGFVDDRDPRKN
jgi:hypothetical protein